MNQQVRRHRQTLSTLTELDQVKLWGRSTVWAFAYAHLGVFQCLKVQFLRGCKSGSRPVGAAEL